MDLLIFVELMHKREQFPFRNRRRQQMLEGSDADFLASLLLIAHVNMRSGIVADEHDSQAWGHSPAALKPVDFLFDLLLNFFGDGLAVNDGSHESTPGFLR